MKKRTLHEPRRVFVGIKLPDEFQESFLGMQSALGTLPGKFIPPEDIHLTLIPPFETRDLPFVEGQLRTMLGSMHIFRLRFLHLDWGPDKERPRLVWVECGATEELISLKKKLLKLFGQKEKIPFIPHMTLARLKTSEIEIAVRQQIRRPVKFFMDVASVELFESPHKGGVGYDVLASVRLQPEDNTPT